MLPALRFAAGALLTGFLWSAALLHYNALLSRVTTPLLQLDPRLRGAVVERNARRVEVRNPVRPDFPPIEVPADQLTYNVILFGGLVAARPGGWRRTLFAIACLGAVHALALAAAIEATYATRMGAWSDQHYGGGEQDFWTAAEYLYRLAGMFAIAFGAWWLSLPAGRETRGR